MNKNKKKLFTDNLMLVHNASTMDCRDCGIDNKPTIISNNYDDSNGIQCSKTGNLLPIEIICQRPKIKADEDDRKNFVKTLRGKARARVHQFFKELRLSNSVQQSWNVDKETIIDYDYLRKSEEIEEEEEEEFPMVNLNKLLNLTSVTKRKSDSNQWSFKEVKSMTPSQGHEINLSASSEIFKSNMASTIKEIVSASSVASVSAATDALVIPMLTEDDHVKNISIFNANNFKPCIATVNGKYMNINIHESREDEMNTFIRKQGLTILNKYSIRTFGPSAVWVEYLVSKKRKAPEPPKPVTPTTVTEKNVQIERPTVIKTVKVSQQKKVEKPVTPPPVTEKKTQQKKVEKPVTPPPVTEKKVAEKRKLVKATEEGLDLQPSTSKPILKKFKEAPKYDKTVKSLESWFALKPEQIKELRTQEIKHTEEVLASIVDVDKSFASHLKGMMIGEPKVTYSPPKERIPPRPKGIPWVLWLRYHNKPDLVESFYRRMFRTFFFMFRKRWLEHTAICKKTKRPLDMNPYLTDFEYMWLIICKQYPTMDTRWAGIEEWKKKVISFYPKDAFNASWHKLTPKK